MRGSISCCLSACRLRLAQQAPAPPAQPEATPAAAFRAVYDSFFTEVTPPRPENPAVLFDRAAEQVCAGCLLQRDCWQAHYNDTYNAFNDACPRLLRRGSACAEDFPLHFASRCLHFPQLLEALNDQLHQFLLRRAHRLQLEEAYQMARQQYAQMSEVLSSGVPVSAPPRFACRTSIALRPREGETLCGDQAASFEAGGAACLLLSDGMGSGEAAHREAAMTVRLLKQFLQAGVEPLPGPENTEHGDAAALPRGRGLHHHRPAAAGPQHPVRPRSINTARRRRI